MILTLLVGALLTIGMAIPSATAAELPSVEKLPVVKELPDPFLFMDGTRVTGKKDWARRRNELKTLAQHYGYGVVPPGGGTVRAEELESSHNPTLGATEKQLLLRMGPEGKVQAHVMLTVPDGDRRFPAIVVGDLCWGKVSPEIVADVVKHGYILAEFDRTEIVADKNVHAGGLYEAFPNGEFGAVAGWAWGFQRMVDYLHTLPNVDTKHIAATGHSRGGKAVLLAGALDERIALTAPNDAGCMGTGCTRLIYSGETVPIITKNFPYWFSPRLAEFIGHEEKLPFDQHSMKALIAPRALLETQALGDTWANPQGAQATYQAAKVVFDYLGAGDKIGIAYRPGEHAQTLWDWQTLLAFADQQFFHKHTERKFNELPYADDSKRVFSWKAPQKPS